MTRIRSGNDFATLLTQFTATARDGQVTPELKKTLGALSQLAVGEGDKRALARAVDTAPLPAAERNQLWRMPELQGASDFRATCAEPELVTLRPTSRYVPLPSGGIEKVRADDPVSPSGPSGPIQKIRADDPVSPSGPSGPIQKIRADDPVPSSGPSSPSGPIQKIRADDPVPSSGPSSPSGPIQKIRADDPCRAPARAPERPDSEDSRR
ncbi:MAG: hypothetical protein IPJ65_41220 [Archangiaceae bacterium]|nr:hypothetical protein [Archangiaceae bacterium]